MKENIIVDIKFSKRESCDYTMRRTTFSEIMNGAKDFLLSNFRGSVRITDNVQAHAFAIISAEGLALYFKTVLCELFNSCLLDIEFKTGKEELTVIMSFNKDNYTFSAVRTLDFIAKSSGFSSQYINDGDLHTIILSIKEDKYGLISLYALSSKEIRQAFNKIFFL